MKINYFIIFFTSIILLQNCGDSDFGKWNVDGISVLKIEGTSKAIYKYSAWGGRDSHAYGFKLMDTTDIFEVNKNGDLPFNRFTELPNKNKISGIGSECANSCGEFYDVQSQFLSPLI